MADFILRSLRGGVNDDPSTISLPDNQCPVMNNVELVDSPLGDRRLGCVDVDLPASISGKERVSFAFRHTPTQVPSEMELWLFAFTAGGASQLARKTTSWADITASDTYNISGFAPYQWSAVSLHGKLFLAYDSDQDRLHVVDAGATAARRVGIAAPVAPTGADDGGTGTFSGTRYYRVRMTVQSGGVTLRRSEPGPVLEITPGGSDTGITVTKPAAVESATHWELEASKDNVNFYVIATTAVGTTTVDDTQEYARGYAVDFDLSEDVGDYTLPWSARYLIADEDRLVWAGSWEDSDYASAVGWSPVKQADGVGDDERYELDTDPILNLDGLEGGPITGMASSTAGEIWVFKHSRIFKLVRTGVRARAYGTICMSKAMGALHGSVVQGMDASGSPCLYFLDPAVGPCRIGQGGIKQCGADLRVTWATANLNATKAVCSSVYYPVKRQVIWNVALTSSNNIPSKAFVLHVAEQSLTQDAGYRGGWTTWDGARGQALTMCLFATNIDDNAARNETLVPFIGGEFTGRLLRCDTGDDDNGTAYAARIVTKPYVLKTIANKFGVLMGVLVARARTGAKVAVKVIRDFGLETIENVGTVTFDATASETSVIKKLDNLKGSELRAAQFEFVDPATAGTRWELQQLAVIESQQQKS